MAVLGTVTEILKMNGHVIKNKDTCELFRGISTEPEVYFAPYYEDAEETSEYLKNHTAHRPEVAIICGTGFGDIAHGLQQADSFDYKDIPHFSVSTVPGHKGRLIFGILAGKCVLCMQGRIHAYEGYSPAKIVFPIRVMKLLGIKTLIVSNASGGLNPEFNVGDIMLIKDHINLPGLCGINPLMGPNDERFGPRFPAMSKAYPEELRNIAKQAAEELEMDYVREGVYVVQSGPCYETPAECRMLRNMGADVTGMSTVPEVTVAVHCGMRTLGMSLVTNKCVMDTDAKEMANHEEVMETGKMRSKDTLLFVSKILEKLV